MGRRVRSPGTGGSLALWDQSTVVEPQWVIADECSLSWRPGTRQRFCREVVDRGRRSDSLGDIATPVVALDEHPSRITGARCHPPVPYIRDKEGNVSCPGHDGNGALAIPLEVVVGELFHRWCLSRCVTSGNNPGRAGLDRAVPKIQVRRDGEHGIGDPGVPGDTGVTRDVWASVDMPEAPEVVVLA